MERNAQAPNNWPSHSSNEGNSSDHQSEQRASSGTQPGAETCGPQIPVRLNRAESLKRIYVCNVDANGNQAQPTKGECGTYVSGMNKLANQTLKKQTMTWFNQKTLLVDKIERHQRAVYDNLLKLEREKTEIKEQMRKLKERQENDGKKKAVKKEEEGGVPQISIKKEKKEEETGDESERKKDEKRTLKKTDETFAHRNSPRNFNLGMKQGEIGSPKCSPREERYVKNGHSNVRQNFNPRGGAGGKQSDSMYHVQKRMFSLLNGRKQNSLLSNGNTEQEIEQKLPGIHERYKKMFERDIKRKVMSSSHDEVTLPTVPGKETNGIPRSNDGFLRSKSTLSYTLCSAREIPAQVTSKSTTQLQPVKEDSTSNTSAGTSTLSLLRFLQDDKQAGNQLQPATTTTGCMRLKPTINDMTKHPTTTGFATFSPSKRRQNMLNSEDIIYYKKDYDGNIVALDFPYKRRQFSLPKEKDEAFLKKLIELEERDKKKLRARFCELCADLERLQKWSPLVEIRAAKKEEEFDQPDKYAKLGSSLGYLVRAFKQDCSVLRGLDPNSEEALRLCRYLRLQDRDTANLSGVFDSPQSPSMKPLETHVSWTS